MKANGFSALHVVVAVLLGSAGFVSAQTTVAAEPWGDAKVEVITEIRNCTVYGLVTDPEHTFWVVCTPDQGASTGN